MRTDERITRIAVLSRRLRWAIWLVVALLGAVTAVVLLGLGLGAYGTAKVEIGGVEVPLEQVPLQGRVLLLAVFTPFIALVLILLWLFDRLLRLYERGVIFSTENAHLIRRSGQILLALALVDTIVVPVCAAILARSASGDFDLSIEPNLGLLLTGVGIIVVGHVMSLGAEMAEESALTI